MQRVTPFRCTGGGAIRVFSEEHGGDFIENFQDMVLYVGPWRL